MRGLQERRAVAALTDRPPGAAAHHLSPPQAWRIGLSACAVVVVDQVTKTLALEHLSDGPVDLVWTLRLRLTFNRGAAFGLGSDLGPILVAAGVVLLGALLVLGRRVRNGPAAVALGLVLGGAVGNLVDRLVRGHGGAVVDFVDLQWWPVFNVADAAITCGAVLLALTGARDHPGHGHGPNPQGPPAASGP